MPQLFHRTLLKSGMMAVGGRLYESAHPNQKFPVQPIVRRHITALITILLTVSWGTAQDYQVRTRVDLVVVPVSVRDGAGKLLTGLTKEDFTVLEDGRPQTISNFSIDPQPLSAAIVIDTGMGGNSLRRLTPLFISVTGGFSSFDEMASFRYDHLVHQLSDFTNDHEKIEKSLDVVKEIAETAPATVPAGSPAPTAPKIVQLLLGVLGGGGGSSGPVDPSKPPTSQLPTVRKQTVPPSRVLYDAVYQAAQALADRSPERRRIIFIISDSQVSPSANTHNLKDTTDFLLRNNIELYSVVEDYGAFEGRFSALSSIADATGGDVYQGLSTDAMERAFSRITEEARNQYVLGYHSTNVTEVQLPLFHTIEVHARDPKWKITHRKGYFQNPS
jgi:VWFA-related protein